MTFSWLAGKGRLSDTGLYEFSRISAEKPQNFQSGMMSVPVTIRDDNQDGASDEGRIVAGTAGFTVKDKGSQVG